MRQDHVIDDRVDSTVLLYRRFRVDLRHSRGLERLPRLLDGYFRSEPMRLGPDGDFPPTGETLAFVLGGSDLVTRFVVQHLFEAEHVFATSLRENLRLAAGPVDDALYAQAVQQRQASVAGQQPLQVQMPGAAPAGGAPGGTSSGGAGAPNGASPVAASGPRSIPATIPTMEASATTVGTIRLGSPFIPFGSSQATLAEFRYASATTASRLG